MTLKILHTADIHIGMKFAGYQEVQAKLSNARIETLKRLIETANNEKCNLLVIAGDLFDTVDISENIVEESAKAISEFSGKLAVVLPGNHDFLSSESSIWQTFRDNQGDKVLLLEKTKPIDLSHYDLTNVILYPAPCHSKHSEVNKIQWIKDIEKNNNSIHIGIAHGSLQNISNSQ